MKEKYKDCIMFTLVFAIAIVIHYVLSFPIAEYTNEEQPLVFGFIGMLATMTYFMMLLVTLTRKYNLNLEDYGIDVIKP